ncbi:FAD-binding oxidoreductase [Neorhizobium galegae]|uniref:FAD-binding oxidoreductase n=1 Tax=Neorhizobium galegae TaxID=399 RepID=UPI0020C7FA88|nr:FAD-binding protein [Neorhizobium galegae]
MTHEFIQALQRELAPDVFFGEDIPVRFHNDWGGLAPVVPLALVRPRTTEQVSITLRLCNEFKVPVVPQGGLTVLPVGRGRSKMVLRCRSTA